MSTPLLITSGETEWNLAEQPGVLASPELAEGLAAAAHAAGVPTLHLDESSPLTVRALLEAALYRAGLLERFGVDDTAILPSAFRPNPIIVLLRASQLWGGDVSPFFGQQVGALMHDAGGGDIFYLVSCTDDDQVPAWAWELFDFGV